MVIHFRTYLKPIHQNNLKKFIFYFVYFVACASRSQVIVRETRVGIQGRSMKWKLWSNAPSYLTLWFLHSQDHFSLFSVYQDHLSENVVACSKEGSPISINNQGRPS